jgi:hypothetical protein
MHHLLSPEEDGWSTTGDEFLSPLEIVSRLKEEFKYVTVDKPGGRRHILGRINHLQNMQAAGKNKYWSKESIEGEIKRLESLIDDTYYVTFADSENPSVFGHCNHARYRSVFWLQLRTGYRKVCSVIGAMCQGTEI